jgi:antitoxin component YwqK of YwqJK toxin-antitoxin module
MKNLIILLLSFGICQTVLCQNKRDKNGKRTGKWVFTGADIPNYGRSKDVKVEEGYFVNGRKEGVWIKYHADGKTIQLKGNYLNNRPEGTYKKFHKDGKLKEAGTINKSLFKDELVRYNSNGKIVYIGNFNNSGMETGTIKYFHENGNLALEYTIKNNALSGKINRYHEDGSLKESFSVSPSGKVEEFEKFVQKQKPTPTPKKKEIKVIYPPKIKNPNTKGVRFDTNGYNKIYNENEEIWMDGDFKNGQLWDGKVIDYDSNGIIQKVRVFRNGVYHSDGQL